MVWEQVYRDSETVWGEKPDWLLAELVPHVPPGRVLDLGMGEGRNAIFFARLGYAVKGIDLSTSAVEKCRERAQVLSIPIEVEVGNMLDMIIEPDNFSLILSTMALQFVKKSEAEILLHRMKQGLKSGGLIYLTVFSIEDPMLARLKQTGKEVEVNTFYRDDMKSHVHFFEKDELLNAFSDLKLHQFAQTVVLDHGHPGVPQPHYHGILTYIGQKP